MPDYNIKAIRDAAISIEDTHPELALDLIRIAKQERPNAPVIGELHSKLKTQLGGADIVVIGNCQAEPLSKIICSKNRFINSIKVITAHLYRHEDAIYRTLDRADFILTQPLADKFPGIATQALKSRYGSKVITFLNLHFNGFHSDWTYLNLNPAKRLHGPMGEYHNVSIIESFQAGLSEDEALERFESCEYNQSRFGHAAAQSLNELRQREASVDIKMTDFIEQAYLNKQCNFHTFNHPNTATLNEEANRILKYLNLPYEDSTPIGEVLNFTVTRPNPISVNEPTACMGYDIEFADNAFTTKRGNQLKDNRKLVADFYRIYDLHRGAVVKFKPMY